MTSWLSSVVATLIAASSPCALIDTFGAAQDIHYERHGQGERLYAYESKERIWFQLRNNTSCPIRVRAGAPWFSRDADGRMTAELPDGQEVSLAVWITDPKTGGLWAHRGHGGMERVLPGGRSIIFSVAANLFKRGPVVVKFEYPWDQGGTVEHRIKIEAAALPHDAQEWLSTVKEPPAAKRSKRG